MRRRRRPGQRALHGVEHELVDGAAVAEAHFDLRRVHVHVDHRRVEFECQHVRREAVAVQHVLVRGLDRVDEQLVAHEAAVDIEILVVGARLRCRRQADVAVQPQRTGAFIELQAGFGELAAENLRTALGGFADVPVVDRAAVVRQAERHVRPRQRDAAHDLGAMAVFGLLGFQELAARWCIEIQILHVDRRAERTGRRRHRALVRADDFPRMRRVLCARRDLDGRDGRDRCQCLAAEAERVHVLEVGQRGDLRRRVARQRERHFLGRDAAAVVGDGNALDAAFLEPDRDLRGTRVERVFQQLLHHGRRPLDDLAGGDLRDELVGKLLDGTVGGGRGVHPPIIARVRPRKRRCLIFAKAVFEPVNCLPNNRVIGPRGR